MSPALSFVSVTLFFVSPSRNAHCPQTHPAARPPKNKDYWTSVCLRTRLLTESLAPMGFVILPAMEIPAHRSNWTLTNPTIAFRGVRTVCTCRTTSAGWAPPFPKWRGQKKPQRRPAPSSRTRTRPFALTNSFPTASIRRRSPKSTRIRNENA